MGGKCYRFARSGKVRLFKMNNVRQNLILVASVVEWSITTDCKSVGFMPTKVRILPGAQQSGSEILAIYKEYGIFLAYVTGSTYNASK